MRGTARIQGWVGLAKTIDSSPECSRGSRFWILPGDVSDAPAMLSLVVNERKVCSFVVHPFRRRFVAISHRVHSSYWGKPAAHPAFLFAGCVLPQHAVLQYCVLSSICVEGKRLTGDVVGQMVEGVHSSGQRIPQYGHKMGNGVPIRAKQAKVSVAAEHTWGAEQQECNNGQGRGKGGAVEVLALGAEHTGWTADGTLSRSCSSVSVSSSAAGVSRLGPIT